MRTETGEIKIIERDTDAISVTAKSGRRCEIPVSDGYKRKGGNLSLIPGLVLRVQPTGAKSWALRYTRQSDGKQFRVTIGTYPKPISLAVAREKAAALLVQISDGADPAKDKRKLKNGTPGKPRTFRELAKRYVDTYCPQKKTGHEDQLKLDLDVIPAIGDKPLDEIEPEDIADILQRIVDRGSPIAANRTFTVIRRVFRWGKGSGISRANPCDAMKPPSREVSRERALSDHEIQTFWRRTIAKTRMEWQMRTLLKLALVTGHRVSEIAGMKRRELRNLDERGKVEWHVPSERMKHKLPHITPLSPLAVRIIKKALARSDHETLVLPGRPGRNKSNKTDRKPYGKSAPARAMRRAQGLDDTGAKDLAYADVYCFEQPATPHDLRRTLGTGLGSLKFNRFIQDRVLAHKDGTVGGIYDRWEYLDQKREALEAWATHLEQVIFSRHARKAPRTDEFMGDLHYERLTTN